ncbi:uncharacterized protein N7483_008018 [Penicillium malachiteum]|uniref:uncharacterized protein n=1 Tax=Penicillium malachiteum TaxID=1324776 RepID=UPI0025468251|nr:uncharacterized protein N7483_008018 [Penicillium malachiteum]KAJ5726661.1 hypothetical protein N7483_008018 [Penicillium malachiteum]
MDESQFRRACDRCHNHKLRCKRNGASGCARCIKAGVNCVFSPSLRGRKSRQGPAGDNEGDQSVRSAASLNSNAQQQDNVPGPTTNQQLLHNISERDGCVGIEDIMQLDLGLMDWPAQDADKSEYSLHPGLDPPIAPRPLSKHDEAQQIAFSSSDSIMDSPKTIYTEFFATAYKDVSGSQMTSHSGDTSGWMTADYAGEIAATPWMSQTSQMGHMSPHQLQTLPSKDYQPDPNRKLVDNGGTSRYNHSPHQSASEGDANPRVSRHDNWVRRLSDINIKLYQHAALMSPRDEHTLNTHSSNYSSFPDDDGSFLSNKDVAVDQTFIITRQLLEILNTQHPPSNGMDRGSCVRGTFSDSLDHGTLLLIFSSYLRVLDVYSAIFRQLHSSLSPHPSRPSTSASFNHPSNPFCGTDAPTHGGLSRFPTLRIGDFSLQAPSSLHTLLVVQLAEQLLQRIYVTMQHLNRRRSQRHSVSEPSPPRPSSNRHDTFDGAAEEKKCRRCV